MLWALCGLAAGLLAGALLPVTIPGAYAAYLMMGILLVLGHLADAMARWLRALPVTFSSLVGLLSEGAATALVAFLGARLGVATEQALLIVLGIRLFYQIHTLSASICHRFGKKRIGNQNEA